MLYNIDQSCVKCRLFVCYIFLAPEIFFAPLENFSSCINVAITQALLESS